MRIVVHGQQAFGKAVLEALLKRGENVIAVYVAPEKPGAKPDPLLEANGVRLPRSEGAPLSADASLFEICNDFERRVILDMLERTNWNQTEAAERFQIPLSTLNQKIKRLGIEIRRKPSGRGSAGVAVAHHAGE